MGDRLIDGEGVTQFQINGIEPGVDSSDPTAFPVRLEYGTPTASFEMRASTPTLAGATEVPAVSSNAVEETIPVAEPSVPTIDLLEQNGNCFNDSDKDCSVNS